jgi:hypothetical protein
VLNTPPAFLTTCKADYSCFGVSIDSSIFKNFQTDVTRISNPVQVNPNNGMLYFGMVVDLDEFNGPVSVVNTQFTDMGPRYTSCDVAVKLSTGPVYSAATDDYPSYGAKTKYQIKSLISIVNHRSTVDLVRNTFMRTGGTKGVVYLDLKHRTNVRRAFIVNNDFLYTSGLIDATAIFIRARAPIERGSVYTRVPYNPGNANIATLAASTSTADTQLDTQYYCSGYHFESNIF